MDSHRTHHHGAGTLALLAMASTLALFLLTSCSAAQPKEEDTPVRPWEDNGIPTVYLTIDPAEFEQVNASEGHRYRASGATVKVEVPEGYTGDYASEPLASTDELELDYFRGRGHGTWSADKKPYKFKLKDGADLLGMGKNKHWVLLANRYDESQLRNRVINYLAARMGSFYAMQSEPVDLVINGEYYGSYTLAEEVRIGSARIDIDELTPEDDSEPEITGGYLLCMCPLDDEPLENALTTDRLVRFGAEEPQFTSDEGGTAAQKAYIMNYLQRTEDAIFSPDLCDVDGTPYTDYLDARSTADYWWVQEYSGNTDAFITPSTYLYKERGGKLIWGPLWDFDLALDGSQSDTAGFMHRNMAWLDHLRGYDPAYQELLKERWTVMNGILDDILKPDGILDQYAAEIKASWVDDAARWPIVDDEGQVHEVSFDESVEAVRDWMLRRQSWINEHIDSDELTHVFETVSFVVDGEVIRTVDVLHGRWLDQLPPAPAKDGLVFVGWQTEDGSPYEGQSFDSESKLTAAYLPQADVVTATELSFPAEIDYTADVHEKRFSASFQLSPKDAADKNVRWNSSDPAIAEVDEYGNVALKTPGEVTISATLDSGVSGSYVLHVTDSLAQ